MNKIIAPNSRMSSASAVLANSAVFKTVKTTGWEKRRTVPTEVLAQRVIEAHKENLREVRDSFRAAPVKLGVACRSKGKGKGFLIIGHAIANQDGTVTPRAVPTFADVKAYAASIGRSFVKMGAVTARV